MDSATLQGIWAVLLPSHVVVEVGGYSTSALPMGASEQMAAAAMQDSRRLEFLSGRLYARKALHALGHGPIDIPIASDRGPQWPDGVVGSITHTLGTTGGWATVALSNVGMLRSLGIDMECRENLDSRAMDVVLTATERVYIKKIPQALRSRAAGLIWCAKEAAIKAARGRTEPSAVEIVLSESGEKFRATGRRALLQTQEEDWVFEGRACYRDDFAFAAAFR